MRRIESVVQALWPQLLRGEKVEMPELAVEHPSWRTDLFAIPPAAWDMGQRCDYVWRLPEGGRIHAQCFERSGRRTVRFHLDKYDPDRGLVDAFMHLVFETPAGPAIALASAVLVVSRLARA